MARIKYQVFVSSTFSDLHEERKRVTWEILQARHIPAGMENFPSTDDRGWKIIERTILDSDYYVLLLAGRYGSVDAEGKSWTEREYDFARANGIPVLTFVREKHAITGDMVETGDGADRLRAFIDKVRATHLNAPWTTAADLAGKVAAALNRAIQDAEDDGASRPGWVRGNTLPSNISEELARLSKENAELRALGLAGRPQISLVINGEPVTDIGLFRPYYKVHINHVRGQVRATTRTDLTAMEDEVDYHNRSFWLALGVQNNGQAVARRNRAQFVIEGAELVTFERLRKDAGYTSHTNPDRLPYVSKDSQLGHSSNGTVIEQRFRDVGIDRTEDLLGMRLTAPIAALDAGELKFKVSYRVDTEDGAKTEGTFDISVRFDGEEIIQYEAVLIKREVERRGF